PRLRTRFAAALTALRGRYGNDFEALAQAARDRELSRDDQLRLEQCAAAFLAHESVAPHGDPVARFHLDNGARLERINVNADLSPKGVRESLGVMVNYLYELDAVEANHERFIRGEIVSSRHIAKIS